jgi:hypothetical protein
LAIFCYFHWGRSDRDRFLFLQGNPSDESCGDSTSRDEPEPTQTVRRTWAADAHGRESSDGRNHWLQRLDLFAGFKMDRNVEGRFKMGQDKLTAIAAEDVLLPEIAFFGREGTIVIGGEYFGVGTKFERAFGGRSGWGIGVQAGGRGGTQMAGERFFKDPVAVVKRHVVLLS